MNRGNRFQTRGEGGRGSAWRRLRPTSFSSGRPRRRARVRLGGKNRGRSPPLRGKIKIGAGSARHIKGPSRHPPNGFWPVVMVRTQGSGGRGAAWPGTNLDHWQPVGRAPSACAVMPAAPASATTGDHPGDEEAARDQFQGAGRHCVRALQEARRDLGLRSPSLPDGQGRRPQSDEDGR